MRHIHVRATAACVRLAGACTTARKGRHAGALTEENIFHIFCAKCTTCSHVIYFHFIISWLQMFHMYVESLPHAYSEPYMNGVCFPVVTLATMWEMLPVNFMRFQMSIYFEWNRTGIRSFLKQDIIIKRTSF